ncbi:MAG: DUF4416 family protein [Proteobacteria bacterium]|nr:DUF4416 family protein [Pseudomonadota bacterium]
MSIPKPPNPAKLVIGVIVQDKSFLAAIMDELAGTFGSHDLISPWFDFNYTNYYENEMGLHLFRRMLVFKTLIRQEDLAEIKIVTNGIESKYLSNGNRQANLDPGYLLLERFVLATGKNYSHRIYIGKSIYADLTLLYEKGKYQVLPWTYPDYAQSDIQNFLIKVREKYKLDLKQNDKPLETIFEKIKGIDS